MQQEKTEGSAQVTIMFGGDIMFHALQLSSAKQSDGSYSFAPSFNYIKEQWQGCDWVIFNLETTLAHDNFSGYPTFATPATVAKELKDIGVTHLMLANNHICDKRLQGINTTIAECHNSGIITAGAFADTSSWQLNSPLYLKKEGFNIALLNYTYGTNGIPIPKGTVVPLIDTTQIAKDIAKAKRGFATNIVVFLHWGGEYQHTPSPHQRTLAKWLKHKGVDLIVGSHPHVVQPLEVEPTQGVTIYSMGNLISNQQKRGTNGGILAKVTLTRERHSGQTHYSVTPLPHYVYIAPFGDTPRYYCLPQNSIKTTIPNPETQKTAQQFFTDTWSILKR